jgi:carbonic anhydrase
MDLARQPGESDWSVLGGAGIFFWVGSGRFSFTLSYPCSQRCGPSAPLPLSSTMSLPLARRMACAAAALASACACAAAAAAQPAASQPAALPALQLPPSASPAPPGGFDGSASHLDSMLAHNAAFVREGSYRHYTVANAPAARFVVLTCMDSRLTHLLPAALNIRPGEAKVIKTAGAILSHPFGGIMRSIIVALYELRASEVFIVGHDDCGMRHVDQRATIAKMHAAGVPEDRLATLRGAGVDVEQWLEGFDSVDASVLASVQAVRAHPLVPPNLRVTGLVMNPTTGALRLAGTQQAAATEHAHAH